MWEKIKKILQKEGGKCIIMKEGEPTYIVTRLNNGEESESSEVEEINQSLSGLENEKTAIQEEVLEKEDVVNSGVEEESNPSNREVKIEDLPF